MKDRLRNSDTSFCSMYTFAFDNSIYFFCYPHIRTVAVTSMDHPGLPYHRHVPSNSIRTHRSVINTVFFRIQTAGLIHGTSPGYHQDPAAQVNRLFPESRLRNRATFLVPAAEPASIYFVGVSTKSAANAAGCAGDAGRGMKQPTDSADRNETSSSLYDC